MASEKATYSKFACVGTGFSGINFGATLQRWYNEKDVRLFERSSEPSGTWHANQYPGCACDVPGVLYSLSYEQNPHWTTLLPSNKEVVEYLKGVMTKYDLWSRTQFNVEVQECRWDEETSRWVMTLFDKVQQRYFTHICQVLFSGVGVLVTPQNLDVPGLSSFKGSYFHSARWDSSVELTGKRVVLFGNGCSATQIVPQIADKPAKLTQIARSRHWLMPPANVPIPKNVRWTYANVPGVMRLVRWVIFAVLENQFRIMRMNPSAKKFRASIQKTSEAYMRKHAPPEYVDKLIPTFEVGCKRRVYDHGYLAALGHSNVDFTDEKAVEIVPEGVKMASGQIIEADVIIAANGFQTHEYLTTLNVVGKGGETLSEHWKDMGGPTAYNCAAVNGFPNFFMGLGPNSATGHTSTVYEIENVTNYMFRVLKPVLDGKAAVAEITREAEVEYSKWMQDELSKTVWHSGGCVSWYVKDDVNGKRFNATMYPRSQLHHFWKCVFPVWKDWSFYGKQTTPLVKRPSNVWRLVRLAVLLSPGLLLFPQTRSSILTLLSQARA